MGFFTNPKTRARVPSETISGGNIRIRYGEFGIGSPYSGSEAVSGIGDFDGIYAYHEGDLFTPGAQNWVFELNFELPLVTIWGNAFLRVPNTFNPLQNPQVYSNPNVVNNGIGGLQAGQMELEPLLFEGS
jgi:hypothetical protein